MLRLCRQLLNPPSQTFMPNKEAPGTIRTDNNSNFPRVAINNYLPEYGIDYIYFINIC